jgi:hypothetical protein
MIRGFVPKYEQETEIQFAVDSASIISPNLDSGFASLRGEACGGFRSGVLLRRAFGCLVPVRGNRPNGKCRALARLALPTP